MAKDDQIKLSGPLLRDLRRGAVCDFGVRSPKNFRRAFEERPVLPDEKYVPNGGKPWCSGGQDVVLRGHHATLDAAKRQSPCGDAQWSKGFFVKETSDHVGIAFLHRIWFRLPLLHINDPGLALFQVGIGGADDRIAEEARRHGSD